jgi:hypothetical protein
VCAMKPVRLDDRRGARLAGGWRWCARLVLPLGIIAAGCSGRAGKAGLSNAPGGTNPRGQEDRGHDAIANGDESCARSGRPEDDPLPNRWPGCPEVARPAASAGGK